MKILVFLQGTATMHRSTVGRLRDERVKQVLDHDSSLYDFATYVPADNTVRKLQSWQQQGAGIMYLSSHKRVENVDIDKAILRNHNFPDGQVFFRLDDEQYNDVAERVLPDILIEDDCESIGGDKEMTYPRIKPALQATIKSIIVKEFGGIEHLPDDVEGLKNYRKFGHITELIDASPNLTSSRPGFCSDQRFEITV